MPDSSKRDGGVGSNESFPGQSQQKWVEQRNDDEEREEGDQDDEEGNPWLYIWECVEGIPGHIKGGC